MAFASANALVMLAATSTSGGPVVAPAQFTTASGAASAITDAI